MPQKDTSYVDSRSRNVRIIAFLVFAKPSGKRMAPLEGLLQVSEAAFTPVQRQSSDKTNGTLSYTHTHKQAASSCCTWNFTKLRHVRIQHAAVQEQTHRASTQH